MATGPPHDEPGPRRQAPSTHRSETHPGGESPAARQIGSFAELQDELEREGVPFRVLDDGQSLSLPTVLADEHSVQHLRWTPTPGIVQFIQPLPLVVEAPFHHDVRQLLAQINHDLAVLGFTFDAVTGAVSFRTQAFLDPEGRVPVDVVAALVATSASTAARFLAPIRQAAGLAAPRGGDV